MARRARGERQALVEQYAELLDTLVDRNMSYQRARAEALRRLPAASADAARLLREAEQVTRAVRAERANRARSEAATARHERRRQEENLARRAAGLDARQRVYAYQPQHGPAAAHDYRTYDVRFMDPRTGQETHLPVRLPIDPGQSNAAIAARIAGALSAHLDISYEDNPRAVYESILEGLESGRIRGFADPE